jgi:hypothetical protein
MNIKNVILLMVMAVLILTNTETAHAAAAPEAESTKALDYLYEGPLAVPGLPEIFEKFAITSPNDDPVYNQSIQELQSIRAQILNGDIRYPYPAWVKMRLRFIERKLQFAYSPWLALATKMYEKQDRNLYQKIIHEAKLKNEEAWHLFFEISHWVNKGVKFY